jgi:hypothetical protein
MTAAAAAPVIIFRILDSFQGDFCGFCRLRPPATGKFRPAGPASQRGRG